MSITLPPLPLPSIDTWPNTLERLRARDIEVARVVLEAAALEAEDRGAVFSAGAIRALEIKHD